MDHQILYFIFGFVLFGVIQASSIDNINRGGTVKNHHKQQIEGGCFHNICNETINYPEEEIRQLIESKPVYKELFETSSESNRQPAVRIRRSGDEEIEEENETNMCGTATYYVIPKSAIDIHGVQQIVVNGNGIEQWIQYQTCAEGASCLAEGKLPGYTVSCRVEKTIVKLLTYRKTPSGERTLEFKSFAIPSGCYCAAKLNN